ncbi:MAG: response regulator [Gammaproteobacteria bacterium]|nr:response regulator [Gammaproteobacteria bacterium]
MVQKSALIVDDSRTAREALRRMLVDHELHVETAESAEAALGFLTAHRPDVIFMDHMMPGMDGFQAVKAIKENPATATIPVMMYTSQSGELYVGQARALGAVGVLPKQIKPVEVREVLRSLRLLPGDTAPMPARRAGDLAGLHGVESVNSPADWSDLHRWLQEMLADHNRALRTDLETSISRVLTEHLPAATSAVSPVRARFWPSGALISALAVVTATFVWLHLDSEAKWWAVTRQNMTLLSELNARRASDVAEAENIVSRLAEAPAGEPDPSAGVAAALEWSVNQSATYRPTALPFGDAQLEKLQGLMDRLRALNFRGTVRLESHVGDFCMRRTPEGTWAMAANDLPASRCDRVGLHPEEARTESARQSVAFANYLAELAVGVGSIQVHIEPLGNSQPLLPYGVVTEDMTAGEWNRTARQNQRVEIRLFTEPTIR